MVRQMNKEQALEELLYQEYNTEHKNRPELVKELFGEEYDLHESIFDKLYLGLTLNLTPKDYEKIGFLLLSALGEGLDEKLEKVVDEYKGMAA